MTQTAVDPLRAYLLALPRHAREALNVTQTVVALVHAATTNHGWTAKQLADESSRDLSDATNAGAVITDRLRKASEHPPVGRAATAAARARLPFCSDNCRDNAGWTTDTDGNLTGRCPCRTKKETAA